jgi:hypothetical protein
VEGVGCALSSIALVVFFIYRRIMRDEYTARAATAEEGEAVVIVKHDPLAEPHAGGPQTTIVAAS